MEFQVKNEKRSDDLSWRIFPVHKNKGTRWTKPREPNQPTKHEPPRRHPTVATHGQKQERWSQDDIEIRSQSKKAST